MGPFAAKCGVSLELWGDPSQSLKVKLQTGRQRGETEKEQFLDDIIYSKLAPNQHYYFWSFGYMSYKFMYYLSQFTLGFLSLETKPF